MIISFNNSIILL